MTPNWLIKALVQLIVQNFRDASHIKSLRSSLSQKADHRNVVVITPELFL